MDLKQKNIILLIIALALVAGSWFMFWPPQKKITMGLDIRGGLSVILTAHADDGQQLTADMMDRAETIIRNRVDGLGVKEASVQRQGDDSLLIQVPGIDDPREALKVIGETGRLEFVDVNSITDTETKAAVQAGDENVQLKDGTYSVIELDGKKLTGEVVKDAAVGQSQQGGIVVDVTMNSTGAKVWGDYTSKNIGNQVAIVLDGTVKSAPVVNDAIRDGRTQISGKFTADEAKNLRTVLVSGSLPVTLEQSEARIVGPTLGQDSLHKGVLAALVGLGLVALYVIIYYRGLGIITASALAVFGSLFMGVLAVMSQLGIFSLTLPGIAGLVLTIGMAADSSILINERVKEEVRIGKSIPAASDSGSRHGIITSIDADVVTLVSAIVLYVFAAGSVKGFALTLSIGIICDIIMMLLYKRPMIMLLAGVMQKAPKFWGLTGPKKEEKGGAKNA